MKTKLYLVRHGENLANIRRMLSSRKVDYPLNERGRLQAGQTADYFRGMKIDAIYASPLKRALETAQTIAAPHSLEVAVREHFREVYPGELEDRPDSLESWRGWYRVTQAWLDGYPEVAFPGGESYRMVQDRFWAGLEEALDHRQGKTVVVVTHVGLLMAIIGDLCPEAPLEELLARETQNCAITEIDMQRKNGRWVGRLVRWADAAHLSGPAAEFTPPLMRLDE